MGDRPASPLVGLGEADLILGFEPLEAARWTGYLKPDGRIVTSDRRLDPMPVVTGKATYPERPCDLFGERCAHVTTLDAQAIAREAGNAKAANLVLIGVAASMSDIPKETWLAAIRDTVPAKTLETNRKAFEAGYGFLKGGDR
jgi:indolepyruvate ferredoxin oxidoreductase beta subunit